MAARIIASLFLSLFFILPFQSVLAQGYPSSTPSATTALNYNVQVVTRSTDNLFIGLIHTVSCLGEGVSIIGAPCFASVDSTPEVQPLKETGFLPSQNEPMGAVGLTQAVALSLYSHPPIRSTTYLNDMAESFGFVTPAYAQVTGSGNAVLSPVLSLWQLSRNLAYLVLIFIFVIIGLMIMFRSKISAQAVIGVQNALPGLVVSLMLITFSYFLASFITDIAFVSTSLAGHILETSSPQILPSGSTNNILQNQNVLTVFNSFLNLDSWDSVSNATTDTMQFLEQGRIAQIVNALLATFGCMWTRQQVDLNIPFAGVGLCIVGGGTAVALKYTIISGIIYILLLVSLAVAMFKLLFSLLGSYLSLIVLTITAPFSFLMGALPGHEKAAEEWIKSMLGNVLAFPAVFLTFAFAAYLMPSTTELFGQINGFNSTAGGATLPLLGGLQSGFIRVLLAYGVLLITPSIPEMVRKGLGVKGDNAAAGAVNTFMGGATFGWGVGQAGYNRFWRGGAQNGQPPEGPAADLYRRARARTRNFLPTLGTETR